MPEWIWDETLRTYRVWSPGEQSWVLQDGRRVGDGDKLAALHQTVASRSQTSASGSDAMGRLVSSMQATTLGESSGTRQQIARQQTAAEPNTIFQATNQQDVARITDPSLQRIGAASTVKVSGVTEHEGREQTDPAFKLQPGKWFRIGKVFKVLWPESAMNETSSFLTGSHPRGSSLMSVRWFVVIRTSSGYSSCVSAQTYGARGVAYPGVDKRTHAILYNGRKEPKPDKSERPSQGEAGMMRPIRVRPVQKTISIDEMMRVNFAKIYTIEHSVKVYEVGDVAKESMRRLERNFVSCWKFNKSAGDEEEEEDDDENVDDGDDSEEDGVDDPDHSRVKKVVASWVQSWIASKDLANRNKALWLLNLEYLAQKKFVKDNGGLG